MASLITRIGSALNVTGNYTADNALFLKVFSGEVMAAFDEAHLMKGMFRERVITSGKSAQFVYTGKASAKYFFPGDRTDDNESQPPINEQTINIDDLLISAVKVYDLDEMKSHYDVRSEFAKQLGQALAREWDQKLARTAILSARATNKIPALPGGSVINAGATVATSGNVLASAIFQAAQVLDEKDIPEEGRVVLMRPAQYYSLVKNLDSINTDWGGQGSYAEGSIIKIAGIPIIKYNRLPNSNVTATAGEQNAYAGNFTDTMAIVTHREAVGTVKLMDMSMEQSGSDYHIVNQCTLFVGKYAVGHGILRPECSVEITKAV